MAAPTPLTLSVAPFALSSTPSSLAQPLLSLLYNLLGSKKLPENIVRRSIRFPVKLSNRFPSSSLRRRVLSTSIVPSAPDTSPSARITTAPTRPATSISLLLPLPPLAPRSTHAAGMAATGAAINQPPSHTPTSNTRQANAKSVILPELNRFGGEEIKLLKFWFFWN